ncbi:MAG: putative lipid II flippase FtsW [Patescibacteria group bacterium]
MSVFTNNGKKADFLLLFVVFLLTVFGLIMVYDASIVEANEQFGDKFHYLKFQSVYFVIGWLGLILAGHLDYHLYKKVVRWLFLGNLIFLVLVLIPGIGLQIKGARRWIDFGITTFQPTETFKTILVLYLATWLEKKRELKQFFALVLFVLGLVILEPDLGTAIVLVASIFIIYYVSGAPVKKFALASVAAFLLGLILILTSPYRRQRLFTFLDPSTDTLGTSYHTKQIILSLGSGGITGLGIGQSKQKYQYLPEATTDSIFAIVGEELGFLGGLALILTFIVVIWKGFKIAQQAPDEYGRLIATGITAWISTQIFVNLASMVALVPLTGIPLPFLSYGGTTLVVTLTSIGVLLNISKQSVGRR